MAPDAETLEGAGSVEIPFTLNATNLTHLALRVHVEGSGPRVQPVQARVELIPPSDAINATSAELTLPAGATAGGQTAELEVPLSAIPAQDAIAAADPDAARAALREAHATTLGSGTWTIRVTLAGGSPGPLAETFTITAEGEATAFEADVRAPAPDVRR